MKPELHTFAADVLSVHDGDTVTIRLRQHFGMLYEHKLRLAGINCPELNSASGPKARIFTVQWLLEHVAPYTVTVNGEGIDKYDRVLGRLIAADGACLNDDLLTTGNAVRM